MLCSWLSLWILLAVFGSLHVALFAGLSGPLIVFIFAGQARLTAVSDSFASAPEYRGTVPSEGYYGTYMHNDAYQARALALELASQYKLYYSTKDKHTDSGSGSGSQSLRSNSTP